MVDSGLPSAHPCKGNPFDNPSLKNRINGQDNRAGNDCPGEIQSTIQHPVVAVQYRQADGKGADRGIGRYDQRPDETIPVRQKDENAKRYEGRCRKRNDDSPNIPKKLALSKRAASSSSTGMHWKKLAQQKDGNHIGDDGEDQGIIGVEELQIMYEQKVRDERGLVWDRDHHQQAVCCA